MKHSTGMLFFDRGDETYATAALAKEINSVNFSNGYTANSLNYCSADSTLSINNADTVYLKDTDTAVDAASTYYTITDTITEAIRPLQAEIDNLKKIISLRSGSMRKGPVTRTLIFNSIEEFEGVYNVGSM